MRIALTGRMRSGKSTAATHLCSEYNFREVAFGDELKRYADGLLSGSNAYPDEYIDTGEVCPIDGDPIIKKRKNRRLYQDFGQLMRQLDEDVWIRHAAKMIAVWENSRNVDGVVVPDLRQPNEYEWARANSFVIIRINAPDELRIERARAVGDDFDIADLTHETERHVDTFAVDYEVNNSGDIRDLERQIDEIMTELLSDKETIV